jgi:hypothetical protein
VGGRAAPVVGFLVDGSLVVQIPPELSPGTFPVVVNRNGVASSPFAVSPAELADGRVLFHTVLQPAVTIGGRRAEVLYSGLTPGAAGVYQINVRIPEGVPAADDVPLTVFVSEGDRGYSDSGTIAIAGAR